MKQTILIALLVSITSVSTILAHQHRISANDYTPVKKIVSDELSTCPIGTVDESDDCILDPNDCSRGIDESNQSSCQK